MKKLFYLIAIAGFVMVSCTKPENPNPNEEKTYTVSIGAEKENDQTDETRIEMIDGATHWSVGDQVGMYMWYNGNTGINNLVMTGTHTKPTRSTTFKGVLTESQISMINPMLPYWHYSYYPKSFDVRPSQWITNGHYLEIKIPSAITIPKNEFPWQHALMYAYTGAAVPPITWLDENGEQQWNERMMFTYRHLFAYLRVKINSNSTPSNPITTVTVGTSTPRSTVIYMSGIGETNLEDRSFSFRDKPGRANSRSVIIEGSDLNVGDEVYIPIPRIHMRRNDSFVFEFRFLNYRPPMTLVERKSVVFETAKIFEAGKVYNISFNL